VIVDNLNIDENEKKEIKKLIDTLWNEINTKPIKPFSK